MKKLNITKRDIKFFLLGVFVVIIIDVIYSWPDAYNGFMGGFRGTTQSESNK